MPRNIQSGWSAPTCIAVNPGTALAAGTLDLTASGVVSIGGHSGTLALSGNFTVTSGTIGLTGVLQAASNLSDVASAPLARANIDQGIGTLVTSGATIATDAATGNVFQATLTNGVGPYVLANPTNLKNGAHYAWFIDQPGTATTLTYGTKFLFAAPSSNAVPPALPAAASAKSLLEAVCDAAGNLRSRLTTTYA